MSELPLDYNIPTFSRLREPIPFLGVPRKHAGIALALLLPLGGLLERFAGIAWTVVFAATFGTLIMFVLRYLFKADPNWVQHATSHRLPAQYWRAR